MADHRANILTYIDHRVTSAACEGINSVIQELKHRSRGSATARTSRPRSSSNSADSTSIPLYPLSCDPHEPRKRRISLQYEVGDLAAVRDPRGCGQNFYYDHAGRLIAEDYVGCDEAMPSGDVPDTMLPADAVGMAVGTGPQLVDVRYLRRRARFRHRRDLLIANPHWVGRISGSTDRAQRSVVVYDRRGQAVASVRQMAVMPRARRLKATIRADLAETGVQNEPTARPRRFDEEHDYIARTRYDYLGRPRLHGLPTDPDWRAMGGMGPTPYGSRLPALQPSWSPRWRYTPCGRRRLP
ncbi:MAG: transposase [Sandaracinaceae bacterium]|nr:transposase [Sandaracinaceae bacterium]